MQKEIARLLKQAVGELRENIDVKEEEIESIIETPPSVEMGDYAFPCFSIAGKIKIPPNDMALQIRGKIREIPSGIKDIQTNGAYINFFLDRINLAKNIISEIKKQGGNFGRHTEKKPRRTMVEFPSPNTNKPLHLGHLKNMSIGESISRILEFSGEKVIRTNLNNDRGIHICKSMLAYQKYGKNKKPLKKIKSDHFVGDFYVLFAKKAKENPKLEAEAHEMLRNWEAGDKEITALAKKMNQWALEGQKQTYEKFEIRHDKEYFESDIYSKGKEIIIDGIKKGIFHKQEDGSVKINLEKEGLGEKYLLRPDGTSLYITQDLYLAKLKLDEFRLDSSIYITGSEQEYHFKVLFSLLKKLGFGFAEQLYHLSYGMVNIPEGKMKSREGTTVDADDLIQKVQDLVKKELTKREKISKKELEKRSLIITLATIKYSLLKTDIKKTVIFNPKESINFEGNTGPYLLYSYARANSIIKKAGRKKKTSTKDLTELKQQEMGLIKKISEFKKIVENARKNLNPSLIANYSYQLAQTFNEFYHTCPVISSENEEFRISLVQAFKQILKNSLYLLDIEVLEKM